MHMTAQIRSVGGSLALTIPKAVVDELRLKPETTVSVSVVDGALVVRPTRPKYNLGDLLAQCDFSQVESGEEQEVAEAPAVGREWGSAHWLADEEHADPAWVAQIEALYDAAG